MVERLTAVQRSSVVDLHVAHVVEVEVVQLSAVFAQADASLFSEAHEFGACGLFNSLDNGIVTVVTITGEIDTGDGSSPKDGSSLRIRVLRSNGLDFDLEGVFVDVDNHSKLTIFEALNIMILFPIEAVPDMVPNLPGTFTSALIKLPIMLIPGISHPLSRILDNILGVVLVSGLGGVEPQSEDVIVDKLHF